VGCDIQTMRMILSEVAVHEAELAAIERRSDGLAPL
jgi:hypothetical protein